MRGFHQGGRALTWRERVARLKREVLTLWLAGRDPRTPLAAKLLAAAVAAYALSPIDLIPDFIPVLGLLDDLIILPAGIWLALRMVPPDVLADCRSEAGKLVEKPVPRNVALAVGVVWVVTIVAVAVAVAWLALA